MFTLEVWIWQKQTHFFLDNLIFLIAPEFLPNWDKQVQELCNQVNALIEKIQVIEPEWSKSALECQISQWESIFCLLEEIFFFKKEKNLFIDYYFY